jgi:hypothetical protein
MMETRQHCGRVSLLDRALSLVFRNRKPVRELCDECRGIVTAFTEWKSVYFSSLRQARHPRRPRQAAETVTASGLIASPRVTILTAAELRPRSPEAPRQPVTMAACPGCGYKLPEGFALIRCARCQAWFHESCFWRVLPSEDWMAHVRRALGIDAFKPLRFICATCRKLERPQPTTHRAT